MISAKSELFSADEIKMAEYAKALSHPARIAILKILALKNACVCGEIVDDLPLAQSTVSQHLKELKKVGLIVGNIEGVSTCYCLNADALTSLAEAWDSLRTSLERVSDGDCC